MLSLLSTNTPPEAEIHAEQQIVRGRRKRVVPADSMKKPDVVAVYNDGMNGVDVNDQYRSYYPVGSVSRKWWKYLLWFFFNLSIVIVTFLRNWPAIRSEANSLFVVNLQDFLSLVTMDINALQAQASAQSKL